MPRWRKPNDEPGKSLSLLAPRGAGLPAAQPAGRRSAAAGHVQVEIDQARHVRAAGAAAYQRRPGTEDDPRGGDDGPGRPGADGPGNIESDPWFVNVAAVRDLTTFATLTHGTVTSFEVDDVSLYSLGDVIEIENDGVIRTVTSASGSTVEFTPALPSRSYEYMRIQIWGAGATDIDEDFHLLQGSQSIDSGDSNAVPAWLTEDFEQQPRIMDGDNDGRACEALP